MCDARPAGTLNVVWNRSRTPVGDVSMVSFKVFGLVSVSICRRGSGWFERTGSIFNCTSNISAGRDGEAGGDIATTPANPIVATVITRPADSLMKRCISEIGRAHV